jgi:hypothetical protein
MPSRDLITLDGVRTKLATLWLGGGSVVIIVVVIQSLLGRFGERTQEAWGWALPTIMPTLGMIVTVLGYTALNPIYLSYVVRKSFFHVAVWLSALYLFLVLLTIAIQPLAGADPVELMRVSNLWLGPFQGLVTSALGVLFVSKEEKGSTGTAEQP